MAATGRILVLIFAASMVIEYDAVPALQILGTIISIFSNLTTCSHYLLSTQYHSTINNTYYPISF